MDYEKTIENKNKKIADLQTEIKTLKKALKLAVEEIAWCSMGEGEHYCDKCDDNCSKYFINKAKDKYKNRGK